MRFIRVQDDIQNKYGIHDAVNLDLVRHARFYSEVTLVLFFEIGSELQQLTLSEPDATKAWKILLGE